MIKPLEKTNKMLLIQTEKEVFDMVIPSDHPFRRIRDMVDWDTILTPLVHHYSKTGTPGIEMEKGVLAMLVQFWEDYSDREMEKCVRENMAVRWFCGFGLMETTPDHSYFSKLRARLGTKAIADLFDRINNILDGHGLFGNFELRNSTTV